MLVLLAATGFHSALNADQPSLQIVSCVDTLLKTSTDTTIEYIFTTGYHQAFDGGGALYRRCSAPPKHGAYLTSQNSVFFENIEQEVRLEMLGCRPGPGRDCTKELEAALKLNRDIELLERTYELHTPLRYLVAPGESISIRGTGKGKSRLVLKHFQPGLRFEGPSSRNCKIDLEGFSIGREVPEKYSGQIGPKTLYISNSKNVRVHSIEEYGAVGFGVQIDLCDQYLIEACFIHDHVSGSSHRSGTDGIHIYRCAGPGIVRGNSVSHVGDDAISFGSYDADLPTTNATCDRNEISECAGSIKLYGAVRNVEILNNTASKAFNGGITLWDDRDKGQAHDIQNVQIRNNLLRECGGPGVSAGIHIVQTKGSGAQSFSNIRIIDNKIIECKNGITIFTNTAQKHTSDIVIRGNTIHQSMERGIFIKGTRDSLSISSNVISKSRLKALEIASHFGGSIVVNNNTFLDEPEDTATECMTVEYQVEPVNSQLKVEDNVAFWNQLPVELKVTSTVLNKSAPPLVMKRINYSAKPLSKDFSN